MIECLCSFPASDTLAAFFFFFLGTWTRNWKFGRDLHWKCHDTLDVILKSPHNMLYCNMRLKDFYHWFLLNPMNTWDIMSVFSFPHHLDYPSVAIKSSHGSHFRYFEWTKLFAKPMLYHSDVLCELCTDIHMKKSLIVKDIVKYYINDQCLGSDLAHHYVPKWKKEILELDKKTDSDVESQFRSQGLNPLLAYTRNRIKFTRGNNVSRHVINMDRWAGCHTRIRGTSSLFLIDRWKIIRLASFSQASSSIWLSIIGWKGHQYLDKLYIHITLWFCSHLKRSFLVVIKMKSMGGLNPTFEFARFRYKLLFTSKCSEQTLLYSWWQLRPKAWPQSTGRRRRCLPYYQWFDSAEHQRNFLTNQEKNCAQHHWTGFQTNLSNESPLQNMYRWLYSMHRPGLCATKP